MSETFIHPDLPTGSAFINDKENDPTGRIEVAFKAVLAAAPVETKLRRAQKQKQLAKGNIMDLIEEALSREIISKEEAGLIDLADKARLSAITVDDFAPEELI